MTPLEERGFPLEFCDNDEAQYTMLLPDGQKCDDLCIRSDTLDRQTDEVAKITMCSAC